MTVVIIAKNTELTVEETLQSSISYGGGKDLSALNYIKEHLEEFV